MDLTRSYRNEVPKDILDRYSWAEVRNAAQILKATNPGQFAEILDVLSSFQLYASDLINPGGSKSALAKRLDEAFRVKGWREARVDTEVELVLHISPYRAVGEKKTEITRSKVINEGYKVDNFLGRIALDVEWTPKDGNLDRDLSAYRALYEQGLIDGAVLITRTQEDLKELGQRFRLAVGFSEEDAKKVLATSTTANYDKLLPRMTRGDAGGCPLLMVAINKNTWDGTEPEKPAVLPEISDEPEDYDPDGLLEEPVETDTP